MPASLPPEIARIEAGIGLQRRLWLAERLGWAAMALLVALALLGLTGGEGPAAVARAEAQALTLHYARIQRAGAPALFLAEIAAEPGAVEARLRLDPAFLEGWRIREVQPPPVSASAGPAGVVLAFRREVPDAPLQVRLRTEVEGPPRLARPGFGAADAALRPAILVLP
jgi:hypothetical protein